jgi:hypothetical protein
MTTTEAEYVDHKQQFHSQEFNKLIMQNNSDSDGDGGIDLLGEQAGVNQLKNALAGFSKYLSI